MPGVAGVGEKTATSLLQQYNTIDGIYEHLDDIPARFRAKLEAGRDSAYLSLKLSTIVTDVKLPFNLAECVTGAFDRQRVIDLFRVLELNSWLRRLPGGGEAAETAVEAAASDAPPSEQMALFSAPE